MKKGLSAVVLLMTCALATPALAQPEGIGQGPMMGGGPGGKGMGPRMYSLQTVTTVKGTVDSITDAAAPGPGGQRGMKFRIMVLKTDAGQKLNIHLAPTVFFEQEKFSLKTGDQVEVTGSKISMPGQEEIIMAAQVKSGGKTLKLRDDQGFPLWRGMGPGPGRGKGPGPGRGPGAPPQQ